MKIYNKKVFASGVFEIALGLLLLITSITRQDLDINSIILIVALFAFGFGSIMRSISQRMAKEDQLEELDERNRLIALKSKSKSFRLTQIISFMLMLTLLAMGKVSGYEGFIAMGVGLVFVLCYQVPQSLIFKDSAALMFLSGSVLIHRFVREWCRNWCSTALFINKAAYG